MPDLIYGAIAIIGLAAVVLFIRADSRRRAGELERLRKLDQQLRDAYEARRAWKMGDRPDA